MAYAPVDEGSLLDNTALKRVASGHSATPAQIALAWLLRGAGIVAIPKASRPEHIRENCRSLEIDLTADDLKQLDAAFPPPSGPVALEMI